VLPGAAFGPKQTMRLTSSAVAKFLEVECLTIEAALQLLYRSLASANLSGKLPTALAAKLYSKVTSGGWQMTAVVLVFPRSMEMAQYAKWLSSSASAATSVSLATPASYLA